MWSQGAKMRWVAGGCLISVSIFSWLPGLSSRTLRLHKAVLTNNWAYLPGVDMVVADGAIMNGNVAAAWLW